MFKVLSLFAGVGGFDLGLERTGGFETVAVAELDAYASKVLALRFPDAVNVGDVTTAEYPNADIICAGFPCQDISYAGAGAGLAGARSGLFWEVVRAIGVVRPRYVILENVAALLSRGLDTVLRALAEIGYDAEWHCIPASAVGAPHRRDRIWIIAHARGVEHEGGSATFSGALSEELYGSSADPEAVFGQAFVGDEPDGDQPSLEGLADAYCAGLAERELLAGNEGQAGCPSEGQEPALGAWWATEPAVGRVAHGVPNRVDRLRCLGNAIVPQIAELIGRAILAAEGRVSNKLPGRSAVSARAHLAGSVPQTPCAPGLFYSEPLFHEARE